jgi:Sec-independent protein translocase protein TatA
MEILGIGPLELLFIILIALIILGPKDLEKTGKRIGKGLTKLVKSDTWKTVQQASEKVRSLPTELIREAGIEEIKQSIDSGVIQPVKNIQGPLDSQASVLLVDGSTDPANDPAVFTSGDIGKSFPPAPREEQSQ